MIIATTNLMSLDFYRRPRLRRGDGLYAAIQIISFFLSFLFFFFFSPHRFQNLPKSWILGIFPFRFFLLESLAYYVHVLTYTCTHVRVHVCTCVYMYVCVRT